MSQITDFLPQLQQLRRIYVDFIELDQVDFDDYCKVIDFYYAHRDVGQFEKMMLDMLFEKDKQTFAIVLSSLNEELQKTLDLYYDNDAMFDNIEPKSVSDNIEMKYYIDIEKLIGELNQCGAEFTDVADMINRKVEAPEDLSDEDAWDKYEVLLAQHQSITERLYAVYQKHIECNVMAKKYYINPFSDLCDLLEVFQDIVLKYLPSEIKMEPSQPTTHKSFFNMDIVSSIYNLCNDEQWVAISELEFYKILNNQSTLAELTVNKGETIRICYLIHLLSERLDGTDRVVWRKEILRKLGISESYYSSKYREPVSELPSAKSKQFAKELNTIFKKQ
ncbi:MAG: hypothetical protein ACRCUJ_06835 [Phocaeicola sp.]